MTNKHTLVLMVGMSMKARALTLSDALNKTITAYHLKKIYLASKLSRQLMQQRLGKKQLATRARQAIDLTNFQEKFYALYHQDTYMVQVDECCFTVTRKTRRHWAPKGDPIRCATHYANQGYRTVVAAIHEKDGLILQHTQAKAFDQYEFYAFLKELREKVGKAKRLVVLLDNCSIHKTHYIRDTCESPLNITLLFNVPYRPDLNGIELFWKVAKLRYYCLLDRVKATMEPFSLDDLVEESLGAAVPHA
jgi:hypothetical protein